VIVNPLVKLGLRLLEGLQRLDDSFGDRTWNNSFETDTSESLLIEGVQVDIAVLALTQLNEPPDDCARSRKGRRRTERYG